MHRDEMELTLQQVLQLLKAIDQYLLYSKTISLPFNTFTLKHYF